MNKSKNSEGGQAHKRRASKGDHREWFGRLGFGAFKGYKWSSEAARAGGKSRTLYLDRLESEGLPVGPVEGRTVPAKQFQIAQLVAILGAGDSGKRTATELAARAVQLWGAAGAALSVDKQVAIATKGLLYFDKDDWWVQTRELALAFADKPLAALAALDETDEKDDGDGLRTWERAGYAVEYHWDRKLRYWGPQEVLRALFPGKGETERTRGEKFLKLVSYINDFLKKDQAAHGGEYRKVKTDALEFSIVRAWSPLIVESEKRLDEMVGATRRRLRAPEEFFNAWALYAFAPVARWFAVMRQMQLAEAKRR